MLWWKKLKLSVGSTEARAEAIEKLAKSSDPEAMDLLIEALQDRDGQVPVKAAEALGRLRNPRSVPALVATLKAPEPYIRWAAAEALAKIGAPAIASVVGVLSDPDPAIRDVAIQALGKIGPEAVPPLAALLRSPHRAVRETAAQALGNINDEQSVRPLIDALSDRDRTVREKAAAALVAVGKPAVPALFDALNHPSAEVRKFAYTALEKLGREPMTETYVRPIAHGKWKDLGEVKAPALDALLEALKDPVKDVRFTAVRNLANIGDDRAVPGLTRALADKDREVRDTAIHALVKIGPPSVNHLLDVLRDGPAELRPMVTAVLGYIGDKRARIPLLAALEDTDAAVRSAAAEALATYKDAALVPSLLAALKDTDVRVRFNAIGSLWQIGDAQAVDGLLGLLDDPDSPTRKRAVQALGNIGDERIIEPLMELFERQPGVRLEAALAIAKVQPAEAVQLLIHIIRESPPEIDDAVDILRDIFEVATDQIAADDLRTLAELPRTLKEEQAGRPRGAMVGKGADLPKVAMLAGDELVRRGLLSRQGAMAAVRGTTESRACPRRASKSVNVQILFGMHQIEPEPGTVLDLSDGGLGLMTRKPYNPGAMLSVRPASAGDDIPWVLVEVRHCRQVGRLWRIGCKFVRSPSYGVLVLFG
jgi:HEAT repeat protein